MSKKKESIKRALLLTFAKGIVYGLGMITAFAIVVPFLVWFASQFDWVPLISDFLMQVTVRMQEANPAM